MAELLLFFRVLLPGFVQIYMVCLVGYYGISNVVGYLMSNPLYTYILNIYDLVWFGLVWFGFTAYQPLLVI